MKKSFTLLFVFFQLIAFSQTATLKGRVIDKESRFPLQDVVIEVKTNSLSWNTLSDSAGFFMLKNLPPVRVNVFCSRTGYEKTTLTEILLSNGKQTDITIELQEKITSIKEIVVSSGKSKFAANNEFASVSARSFSVEETKRYAATLNDPARMVQTFAGVVSAGDDNNQIIIRGNSPKGLLWRMEGVEIPNPNHFAGSEGSTGGGVCMLSSNMLGKTDFYSAAFPAEFGNAISGVFDMNLRKGNKDKWEQSITIGVLGLEASAEGPFSKKYKGSYLINYRYSTLNVLAAMGLKLGGNQVPNYQDLAFNFSFPTKKAGNFTLFGMGGISKLGNTVKNDSLLWKTRSDKTAEKLFQQMGVVGITHQFYFKDQKTTLKSVLSINGSENVYQSDTFSNAYIATATEQNRYINIKLIATTVLQRKIDSKNTILTGFIYNQYFYNLFRKELNPFTNTIDTKINIHSTAALLQYYWQWKHKFSSKLFVTGGMHLLYATINKKFYLEPRINMGYIPAPNHELSAGLGLHSKMDPLSTYAAPLSPASTFDTLQNYSLNFTRSFHAVVGYSFRFLKDFRIKTEIYAQYLFDIPVGKNENSFYATINYTEGFYPIPLYNVGKGLNYGIELTAEKLFSHNYYFMLNLSLFNSKYKSSDNIWRNTAFNSNYVFNVTGGKEFVVGKKKINRIGVNAKIIWRGGLRDTPIDLDKSKQYGTTLYQTNLLFTERVPDYFRIDFGASFRRNKKKYAWVISADIQNLTNRLNYAYKRYNADIQNIEIKKNLGIIPVLNWKVEF